MTGRQNAAKCGLGRRLPTCAICLLFVVSLAAADETELDARGHKVDALFADLDHRGSPGAAVAIAQHGKVLYSRGFGYADLENDIPVTPQTVFHVASLSKQFTAFAIALLARDGKVDLDADIRGYLPYVPDFGYRINVQQLIHHTSGLRDQWALFQLGGQDMRNVLSQAQIVNMVKRQRALNFAPGTQFSYSNTGYTLLAEIVAKVTDGDLRRYTSERIFRPLGMTHTFFYDDVTELVMRRAQSYSRDARDGRWHRALLNYDNVGATSLHTTAEDLMKWAGNFAQPVVGDAGLIRQIVAPGHLSDGTPIVYGFGVGHIEFAGHEAIMHTGGDAAFAAFFGWFPQSDLAVAVLMNNTDKLMERAEGIVHAYLGPGTDAADQSGKARAASPAMLQAMVGSYLNAYGQRVVVSLEQGQPKWQTLAGGVQPLHMGSDATFDTGDPVMRRYRPQLDAAGNVTGFDTLILGVSNDAARYRRVSPVRVGAHALAEVTGDYRSEELDTTYTLAVENGRLTARSLWRRAPIELVPVAPDRYDSADEAMATVIVERGANGRPVGLRIHSERARNIELRRVPRAE